MQKTLQEKIQNKENIIVDFYASWCGPCQMFLPIVDEVKEDLENVEIFKVDIDTHVEYAAEQEVTGVPTVIFFKDGEEVHRFNGFKDKNTFTNLIKEHYS